MWANVSPNFNGLKWIGVVEIEVSFHFSFLCGFGLSLSVFHSWELRRCKQKYLQDTKRTSLHSSILIFCCNLLWLFLFRLSKPSLSDCKFFFSLSCNKQSMWPCLFFLFGFPRWFAVGQLVTVSTRRRSNPRHLLKW